MATWKLYPTATAYGTQPTLQGGWEYNTSTYKTLSESKEGTLGYQSGTMASTDVDYDTELYAAVSSALTEDRTFSGAFSGCIGFRGATGLNGYPRIHAWVRVGSTGSTVRGTIINGHVDSDNELGTTALGRAFSGTLTEVAASSGDTIIVEIGVRSSASSQPLYPRAYYGGTDATDLSEGAAAATYSGWIELEYGGVAAPVIEAAQVGSDIQVSWT